MQKKCYLLSVLLLTFFPQPKLYNQIVYQGKIKQDTISISSKINPLIFIQECEVSKSPSGFEQQILNIKVIDFVSDSLIQLIKDSSAFCYPSIDNVDINLDGYLDIDIEGDHSGLSSSHVFWIYDSTKSIFVYSEEFSELYDYSIDHESHLIESYVHFLGGRGFSMKKYKILDGHLSIIESEYSEKNNYEHKEIINGVLRTTRLDEEKWEVDDEGNSLIVIDRYDLIHDSLMLTKRSWLTYFEGKITEDVYNMSDIYECGPWGECLKYLRSEEYTYAFIDNNFVITNIRKYQVINDNFEEVKHFIK